LPNSAASHQLIQELREIQDAYINFRAASSAFVMWYARNYFNEDDRVAQDASVGASCEQDIDLFYVDNENQTIYLAQCKYHNPASPAPIESRNVINSFASIADAIYGNRETFDSLVERANDRVQIALKKTLQYVRKRGYSLRLYFVTLGKVSPRNKSELIERVSNVNDQVELVILDKSDVLNLVTNYQHGNAPSIPSMDLNIESVTGSRGSSFLHRLEDKTGIESWIFSMRAKEVGQLYTRFGPRLFNRNIRGFLDKTYINDELVKTLKCDAQHFWHFNNGITLVCESAKETPIGDKTVMRLRGAQIVNGQQTTRILHRYPKTNASVLVKVIGVPRREITKNEQYDELIDNLVTATNRQNSINAADLKSNDSEQVRIQREFLKLKCPILYLRKRQGIHELSHFNAPKFFIKVDKVELAQCVVACTMDPARLKIGRQKLFQKMYSEIFSRRPALEYASYLVLHRIVKRSTGKDNRKSYAKWQVIHFLWQELRRYIKGADRFNHFLEWGFSERDNKKLLDKLTKKLLILAVHFYQDNYSTEGIREESRDFFAREGQNVKFHKYVSNSGESQRYINQLIKKFGNALSRTS